MMDPQNKIWLVVFFVILIVSSTNVLGFICRVGDVKINETYYYNNTLWNSTGTFLYPWDLNHWLGIGTPTPSHPLNVLGIGNFTGILYVNDNEQVCTAENALCALAKNTTEQMQDAAWSAIGTGTYIDIDYLDGTDTVNFNVTMTNCSVNGSCTDILYITSGFSGDVTGDSNSLNVIDTQGLSASNITSGTFADSYIASYTAWYSKGATGNCAANHFVQNITNGTIQCSLDQTSVGGGNTTEEMQDAAWSAIGTGTYIDIDYLDGSDIVNFNVTMTNCSLNGSCSGVLYVTSGFSGDVTGDSNSLSVVDTQGLSTGNITSGTFAHSYLNIDQELNTTSNFTVANLTLTGFTNGSVLYIAEDGMITEYNSAFFFEPDGASGKLAVGSSAVMRNIFQAVKDEGITNINNTKALIAVRNQNTNDGTFTGYTMQTKDTVGNVYSGVRLLANFTSHSVDNISADFIIEIRHEGDRKIKSKFTSGGDFYLYDLANCDTIDTDANGMFSCGTDANDPNCSVADSCSELYYGAGLSGANITSGTISDTYIAGSTNWYAKGATGNCAANHFVQNITNGTVQCSVDQTGSAGNTTEQMQDAAWSALGTGTYIDIDYLDGSDIVNFNVTMTNCSVANSCPTLVYSNNVSWVTSNENDALHDECSEITNCIANAWDADGDIAIDTISESKINFVTACGPGNHYYLNGNDLACEADDIDDAVASCTDVNLCTIDAESMEGVDWGTMTDAKWCVYDQANTEVDCNVNPVVNTDTQDLSYDAGTGVISLVDGGNIDITSVDTDTTYTNLTPINITGTTLSLEKCADNEIYKMNGATWNCEADADSSGAPTDADYLVGTANAGLSAEIVVGATPGGELGGTWASPTIDDNVGVSGWGLTIPTVQTTIFGYRDSDTPVSAFILGLRKARDGDPTDDVSNGDYLGYIRFEGYHTDGYDQGALIQAIVDNTPGNTDMPARLEFLTSSDGSSNPTLRLAIDSLGNVKIGDGVWTNYVQINASGALTFSGKGDIDLPDNSIEDSDIAIDIISESKIAFSTACAAGHHYYLNGNDLACEADDVDDAVASCTNVNACTIDAESMEGVDWGTMTDAKWCVYDLANTEVDCNVNPVVDTSANTICAGGTTYLDGDGNCDTGDAIGACAANAICLGGHTHIASEVTAGTFGTGDYVMDGNLTVERVRFETAPAQNYMEDNGTCIILHGETSTWSIC